MIPHSPSLLPAEPPPSGTDRIKIRNWPDEIDPIQDDTPLIRYMRLEAFLLLLLQNSVFIPTLELLQSMDNFEARIPLRCGARYNESMEPIITSHSEWLLHAAGNPEPPDVEASVRDSLMFAVKDQAWRNELAKRRCVWCWNRSTEQLNFMWKIYGDRGVAVFSTVGRIRKALAGAAAEGIVSPVRYIPTNDSIPGEGWNVLTQNVLRPHLFKDSAYQPEREVRFVLKVDPRQTGGMRGAMIEADARSMIDKISISPHVPQSEAFAINMLAFEKRFPSRTLFSPNSKPVLSSSFVAEPDLPEALFPDLDG